MSAGRRPPCSVSNGRGCRCRAPSSRPDWKRVPHFPHSTIKLDPSCSCGISAPAPVLASSGETAGSLGCFGPPEACLEGSAPRHGARARRSSPSTPASLGGAAPNVEHRRLEQHFRKVSHDGATRRLPSGAQAGGRHRQGGDGEDDRFGHSGPDGGARGTARGRRRGGPGRAPAGAAGSRLATRWATRAASSTPGLTVLHIDPFEALAEYLSLQIGMRRAGQARPAQPGLPPAHGGLARLARAHHPGKDLAPPAARGRPRRARLYDLVVVDAPGHRPRSHLPRRSAGGPLGDSRRDP